MVFFLVLASTAEVETRCLCISISFGVKPKARPTSWGRCSTGRLIFLPLWASARLCVPSNSKWQSGQGVTMASAPLSFALYRVVATHLQRVFLIGV